MPTKVAFEQIRKLVGWCPACNKTAQKAKQPFTFVNMLPISGKTDNSPEFQTFNVLFPANTTLFLLYFIISFNLLLRLRSPEGIPFFLAPLPVQRLLLLVSLQNLQRISSGG